MSRIIDISTHRRWGDSIYFLDYKNRKMIGHMTPKPEVGDKIKVEVKRDWPGRYFKLFTIVKLGGFSDPPDQFFADVVDTGIIVEKENNKIAAELGSKCPFCRRKFRKDFLKMIIHLDTRHKDKLCVAS